MTRTDELAVDELLGSRFECECGRTHHVPTRSVIIAHGAVESLPEVLDSAAAGKRALVVADCRTWDAAGISAAAALGRSFCVERCLVPDDATGHVHASVELVDEIADEYPDRFDSVVAVGSGTINDLAKELAHRRRRPYVAVATAASMPGYTSSIVALLDDGLKTTKEAAPPVAVLADPEVLCAAPLELTLAGLGDLVSKPYCGCDWWIASLVRGEHHCPVPGRILGESFDRALEVFPRLGESDEEAVTALARLLILSGLTMTIAGSSSPASGGEHLLSHYWDMINLRDGRDVQLHGAQVGVASVAMDALYQRVLEADFGAARWIPNPTEAEALADVEAVFGSLAGAVGPQWQAKLAARSRGDLERMQEHEREIKAEIVRGCRDRSQGAAGPPGQWCTDVARGSRYPARWTWRRPCGTGARSAIDSRCSMWRPSSMLLEPFADGYPGRGRRIA